jgi:hypothetical protein
VAPGPFALADAERVRSILGRAGFESIDIRPFDARIGEADLEQTLRLSLKVGPLGAALRAHPECADRAAGAVKQALSHFVTPHGVLMTAAVWIVLARNAADR